ncbi:MAG: LuxR C-terminal-related transcriptional regulator [Thermoanaerobaculia bacterium]|nr:LuxR C-terminal-related transcriptional regulator [Thermoanaerobaculia bacterium]
MNQSAGLPKVSPANEPPAFAIDGRNRIVYMNPGAEVLLGVRGHDVIGCDLTALLSRGLPRKIAGAALLRIPGSGPSSERTVYLLRSTNAHPGSCPLSRREHEVVALLADGFAALNIAARLNLSHATVRNHIQNALRRLEVHSQVELVALALRRGWADRQEPPWTSRDGALPLSPAAAIAARG